MPALTVCRRPVKTKTTELPAWLGRSPWSPTLALERNCWQMLAAGWRRKSIFFRDAAPERWHTYQYVSICPCVWVALWGLSGLRKRARGVGEDRGGIGGKGKGCEFHQKALWNTQTVTKEGNNDREGLRLKYMNISKSCFFSWAQLTAGPESWLNPTSVLHWHPYIWVDLPVETEACCPSACCTPQSTTFWVSSNGHLCPGDVNDDRTRESWEE